MQHLEARVLARGKLDGTIVYCPAGRMLARETADLLAAVPHLVIFHPQMLGVRETLALMQRRADAGRVTHLYLLDNFFFCLRSYNHLDREVEPCFRCLGDGAGIAAVATGCVPWPARDPFASAFIAGLERLAAGRHVRFFAQNRGQIELAHRHFGQAVAIDYVGLWCADWTAYVDAFSATGVAEGDGTASDLPYDIVYHGSRDPAKGLLWVLAVAELTPEFRYLVPIDRGNADVKAPGNVTVTAMRWENGLHAAVRSCRLALAPSLWSSPCEGALIKNIVTARAPAVVDIPSAFSAEIPPNVVARLPTHPAEAAAAIRRIVADGWKPDASARRAWVAAFRGFNESVAARLLPPS
jgi:hypothetical protein